MRSMFRSMVDTLPRRPDSPRPATDLPTSQDCAAFLAELDLGVLETYVFDLVRDDSASVHRRMVSNPPALLELDTYQGFMLELLFWYPLPEDVSMAGYDTEDIHDHFGYVASRMLKGPGYVERLYTQSADGKSVQPRAERKFGPGDVPRIIEPDTIHSVVYPYNVSSLSVRIVLPPVRGVMTVFEPTSLKLKETIVCSSERKGYEMAGILSMLQSAAPDLDHCVDSLAQSVVLPEMESRVREFGRGVRQTRVGRSPDFQETES